MRKATLILAVAHLLALPGWAGQHRTPEQQMADITSKTKAALPKGWVLEGAKRAEPPGLWKELDDARLYQGYAIWVTDTLTTLEGPIKGTSEIVSHHPSLVIFFVPLSAQVTREQARSDQGRMMQKMGGRQESITRICGWNKEYLLLSANELPVWIVKKFSIKVEGR